MQIGAVIFGDRRDASQLGGASREEQGEGKEDEDARGEAEDAEVAAGRKSQEGHGKKQSKQ